MEIESKEQMSYDELLENVEFRTNNSSSLRIDPPTVKKVNRDSVFTNYKKFMDVVNESAQDIKYDNYFLDFLKQESSTTCDVSKEGVVMRGNFRNKHIQTIIVKFFNKYKKCETCSSFNSYLYKNNRNLYKKCLDCSSEYCI